LSEASKKGFFDENNAPVDDYFQGWTNILVKAELKV